MDEIFEIRAIPGEQSLDTYISSTKEHIRSNMLREGYRLMSLMKERTPVRSGALRDSGRVHEPEVTGYETTVALSFGNEHVRYAVIVHEKMDAKHSRGQAKYMESVIQEQLPYIGANLAKDLT